MLWQTVVPSPPGIADVAVQVSGTKSRKPTTKPTTAARMGH
jgi:hypothetical protein